MLNHAPTVKLRISHSGYVLYPVPIVGNTIKFTAKGSDRDHDFLYYEWDLNGDGRFEVAGGRHTDDGAGRYIEREYGTPGPRRVTVRVTDYPQRAGGEGRATATTDFKVYSEDEARSGQPPVASFTTAVSGKTVRLDASASSDPDGDRIARYRWDFDQDYFTDLDVGDPVASWTFDESGEYTISLRVVDDDGFPSKRAVRIVTIDVCSPPTCGAGSESASRSPSAADSRVGATVSKPLTLPLSARFKGKSLRMRLLDLPGRPSWAERTLRGFLRSALRPRLRRKVDTSAGRLTAKGIALARGRRHSRACVRVSLVAQRGSVPTGRFLVLGGSRAAARLRASGTFRFAGGTNGSAVALGTVRARRGPAHRMPRACRALLRKHR